MNKKLLKKNFKNIYLYKKLLTKISKIFIWIKNYKKKFKNHSNCFLVRLNTPYRCDYFSILGFQENSMSQLTWFNFYETSLYRVDRGKLSQWLYWEKNLLDRSTGHILDVSVNANSFCVQCSVMVSAALTRDQVLHYLLRQVKFYSLSFHVIDIKRLFQCNKLLYYFKRCPFTEYLGYSTT